MSSSAGRRKRRKPPKYEGEFDATDLSVLEGDESELYDEVSSNIYFCMEAGRSGRPILPYGRPQSISTGILVNVRSPQGASQGSALERNQYHRCVSEIFKIVPTGVQHHNNHHLKIWWICVAFARDLCPGALQHHHNHHSGGGAKMSSPG